MKRLLAVSAAAALLAGCGTSTPQLGDHNGLVARGSSVPGLQVALLGLSSSSNAVTARFRVTNVGAVSIRSRVFGDPAVHGIDRQLGRDLGGAFLFDTQERALYSPLRGSDSEHKVQGDEMPAELGPGQTVEVSVQFQKPAGDTVDVGFPTAVPFLQQHVD